MIASSLFVAVMVLGVSPSGPGGAAVPASQPDGSPSHLFVPTGIAVPVERNGPAPAPAQLELFGTRRCVVVPTGLVAGRESPPAHSGTS